MNDRIAYLESLLVATHRAAEEWRKRAEDAEAKIVSLTGPEPKTGKALSDDALRRLSRIGNAY